MSCNSTLPLCAVWAIAGSAFVMGLPLLQGSAGFVATTSVATVGLALSYAIPIGLQALAPHQFQAGAFTLGR